MRQEDYTQELLKRLDENNQITCEDCGQKDDIGHGIIDHDTDTLKVVCHNCFTRKYQDFLYPEEEQGEIH